MKQFKILGLVLVAIFALASVGASTAMAVELPDIHFLPGEEAGGTTATGSVTKKAEVGVLETEVGSRLTGSTFTSTLTLEKLSALGKATLTFGEVIEAKSKESCETEKSGAGKVVVSGEYHVVPLKLEPLTLGVLVLFSPVTILCNTGKLKVKVTQPAVVALKVEKGKDVTKFGVKATCAGKGKQELTSYFNDEKELTKQLLLANFGLGNENACEEVKEEVTFTSGKMIEFLG